MEAKWIRDGGREKVGVLTVKRREAALWLLRADFTVHGPVGFFFDNEGGWEFLAGWVAGLGTIVLLAAAHGRFALRRAHPRPLIIAERSNPCLRSALS